MTIDLSNLIVPYVIMFVIGVTWCIRMIYKEYKSIRLHDVIIALLAGVFSPFLLGTILYFWVIDLPFWNNDFIKGNQ